MAPASAGVFFVLSGWEGGIRAFSWKRERAFSVEKAVQKDLTGEVS